jgi:hypothetical protein
MKKVFILSILLASLVGYYLISFYPYVDRINQIITNTKISDSDFILKKEILEKDKRINLESSKSSLSINSLLRRQAMMLVYNDFVVLNRRKLYRGLWRFDRLLWSYMSYFHFNNNEIIKIYLFYQR